MPVTRARLVTPSDEALTRVVIRYAIALRLGGTAACAVAAPLAVTGVPAALWVVLAVQAVWTGVFAYALPRSPAPPVVLADVALVTAVVLAQERLVPAGSGSYPGASRISRHPGEVQPPRPMLDEDQHIQPT
jgi:hypothetical protein